MKRSTIVLVSILLTVLLILSLWLVFTARPQDQSDNSTIPPSQTSETDNSDPSEEQQSIGPEYTSEKGIAITVDQPAYNATVGSPLTVTGQVPGNWSFEATFPIKILDANRQVIGESYATLTEDWMTEEYVPYEGEVTFERPTTESGFLILENANASGLDENADRLVLPIRFE